MKGEEITISYMSPLRRRGFTTGECRRRILYHEFGFICCCDVCALGKMESWNPGSNDILSDGKKNDDYKSCDEKIEKGSTNKGLSYPWKQSVPLSSPSSLKTFFHSPRHLNSLLSRTSTTEVIKERDEQSSIVPKGVIVTRIEL